MMGLDINNNKLIKGKYKMAIDTKFVTAVANKDYSAVEKVLSKEVEAKMKTHLSGFSDFVQKNAFTKKED